MEPILIGTVDRSILVFIPDPASTVGKGKTGLNAAALTVSYTRVETDNDVIVTDVTSSLGDLAALTSDHADWGVKEVSATLAPGLYRLDVADAVFASGAWYAVVYVTITSGLSSAVPKAFRLIAYNELDGVRLGLTALPNAAADAAGGLPISDAGGLDLDAERADVAAILVDTGTTLDGKIDAIGAKTTNLPSDPADASDIAAAFGTVEAAIAAVAADVWAEILEGVSPAYSALELMRLIASALLGKSTGLDTGNPVYRDLNDTTDRIDATTDADGNRSSVTLDPS